MIDSVHAKFIFCIIKLFVSLSLSFVTYLILISWSLLWVGSIQFDILHHYLDVVELLGKKLKK